MSAMKSIEIPRVIYDEYKAYAKSMGADKYQLINETLEDAIEDYKLAEELLKDCEDIDAGRMETKPLKEVLKAYGMDY